MYEKFFRHILFPAYEALVRRRNTHQYLAEYECNQWMESDRIEQLRLAKLNALLEHCWENVSFLRSYWLDFGIKRTLLREVSELSTYPVLSKDIIRDNYDGMRAQNVAQKIYAKSTGGSTGDPFRFEYSEESYARRTAVMWRGYRWCGADLGRRTLYLWAVSHDEIGKGRALALNSLKERAYHGAFNRKFLNAFAMSEDSMVSYVKQIAKFEPKIVVGYVGALVSLSRWMLERGFRVLPPLAIVSAAETLTSPDRAIIEDAFDAPVFNTYGCREFMLIACECSERSGMHISADHLVVEVLDDQRQGVEGSSGDVCITDLHNFAMPFVRYLNGDKATLSGRICPCGRSLPLLDTVDGRLLDVIKTPDGRVIPGELFVHTTLEFPSIRQYQAVQTSENEIEFRLVSPQGLSIEERALLEARLRRGVGTSVDLVIREVTAIPELPSGKRRITVAYRNMTS